MMTSVIGTRYAHALVETLFDSKTSVKPEDAVAQLKSIEEIIHGSQDLHSILMTPAVQSARKKVVIGKLADQAGVSRVIKNFLYVVLDHHRIDQISQIREALEVLLDERLGVVRAEVSSAQPLSPEQARSIEAQLGRVSGKQIRMHTTVDPELLGGVVARIGSTVYDGSIRGQLEVMRRKLTTEAVEG